MKKLFLLFGFALLFPSPAFAGGPSVIFEPDPSTYGHINSDGSYSRTITALDLETPCEGDTITFKFVNPQDGDSIVTPSGNAAYVFTTDSPPFYKDGAKVCGTTVTMTSKVQGQRDITATIFDGIQYTGAIPTIKVDFTSQNPISHSYGTPKPIPSATIAPTNNPSVAPQPNPSDATSSANDNPKIDELNQKVGDLQNQLQATQQKQNMLEQTLNNLLAWIKSHFPFFH